MQGFIFMTILIHNISRDFGWVIVRPLQVFKFLLDSCFLGNKHIFSIYKKIE